MAHAVVWTLLLASATLAVAQRPFYAGYQPIGYPAIEGIQLSNRFGESAPVPIETKGDVYLINRIESMPIDNRPFWYTNWKYYDAMRRQPQTWPLRPNNFISK